MKLSCPVFLLLLSATMAAQQPDTRAATPAGSAATVSFNLVWDQGQPWTNYSITVQADGKAHFEGTASAHEIVSSEKIQQDFTMSAANRQKIFELARRLNYFDGDFEAHRKRIANTGEKTLKYSSPQFTHATAYNWSQNADVEELTRLFQAISTTMSVGCKLNYLYRFDKLGMDDQLEDLASLQRSHAVEEVGVIEPILRKIAGDPGMMHISRQVAEQLLQSVRVQAAVTQPATQP